MIITARPLPTTGTRPTTRAAAWVVGLLPAFAVVPTAVQPTVARADNPIVTTFSWASSGAWAGQAVQRNGRFYW